MFARFGGAIFLAVTLGAQAPVPVPAPESAPGSAYWAVSEFEYWFQGVHGPLATGYILYMRDAGGRATGTFECTNGQIFASIAPAGVEPRSNLEEQWSPYGIRERRVRWAGADGEWSRGEGWAYAAPGHYRPVDFETKMAVWTAAKAGERLSIRSNDEDISVDWPPYSEAVDDFIEKCGWAED